MMPHNCSLWCLGPLTFHSQAVGNKICLSEGCRHAERTGNTFRDGLVFISRPVNINEKILLRVQKHSEKWKGALRLGFTNLPPSSRSLPLASMAIPNLTKLPGHWAAPVHEPCCQPGSELKFWVSAKGKVYFENNKGEQFLLVSGVDVSRPLWAMIDLYGQTRSIALLGSEKRFGPITRRSCPAPKSLFKPEHSFSPEPSYVSDDCVSCLNMDIPAGSSCVVCMVREATITLPCAHRCLCRHCSSKFLQQFSSCPLCRCDISCPGVL